MNQNVLTRLIVLLGTGFGTGYSKKAPGTLGSLVGLPLAYAISASSLNMVERGILVGALLVFGFYITAKTEQFFGGHDDQRIVIDEVIGQIVTIAFFEASFFIVVAGFALFRLFDIWKPGPIGYIDENLPGAWGTFFDDILAGIAGACVLAALTW